MASEMSSDPGDITLASYAAAADMYLEHSERTTRHPDYVAYLDAVAAFVGRGAVLELGSGPGRDALQLEDRGLRVTRSDANPVFLDRLRAAGHDAVLLDARRDDLGGPYDAILAGAVLLHLSRAQLADLLRRAGRAVRPGGALAATFKEGDGEAWSTAKLDLPRHFVYWREAALREALEQAGWSVVSLQHVGGSSEPWLFVLAQNGERRGA